METFEDNKTNIISVGDWLVTYLILAIPLVGLIMLFVWAFSRSTHPSKANWAKALLVLVIIGILLSFILFYFFRTTFMGLADPDMMNSEY